MKNKKGFQFELKAFLKSCGGKTRTYDLWVMSPTSYHCSTPRYSLQSFRDCECKGMEFLVQNKFIASFF